MGCCACAGVYFEKYVKGRHGQSLWVRNLQLSIYGVPLAVAYSYLRDGRRGPAPTVPIMCWPCQPPSSLRACS